MPVNHWDKFAEFCRYEMLTGGPDPHMAAVIKMCDGLPMPEKVWRVACYVGVYNVPSAEAIWNHWSGATFLRSNPDAMRLWLDQNIKGLRWRRERRTANSPIKLTDYFSGYARTLDTLGAHYNAPMDLIWDFALSLPRVGRYAATKLVECWQRIGLIHATLTDIRARGGWSPRKTLAMLYPEHVMDEHDDSPPAVALAENLAAQLQDRMLREHNLRISMFDLEVMLCEYKESIGTLRQYPGRSLDSELTYERAVAPYWGTHHTEHLRVRRKLHPSWALGELNGWDGVRKELGTVLALYGYTWTDSLYNYHLSAPNLRQPVLKG